MSNPFTEEETAGEKTPVPDGAARQPVVRPVAVAVLEQLRLWGVKRIYGVVGDAIFGLMDALAKQREIQFIAVKHESVAALMASAEAKCTGGLGVCAAQMGPGLANLINGLGDACLDQAPVLAITGQAPLSRIGTAYKQLVNQQELVQAVTGFSQLAVHPDAVVVSISRAIHAAVAMGTAVHLSVPADVFAMPTTMRPFRPLRASEDAPPDPAPVQRALQWMRRARRPMLLIGGKARFDAAAEIQALAEAWGGGIAHGYGAPGGVPDAFPLELGGLGEGGNPFLSDLFKQADVVVAVETSWWPQGHVPDQADVIQVERRSMRLGNGMPVGEGIVGSPQKVISSWIEGLKAYEIDPDWARQIQQCKRIWTSRNESEGKASGWPLHPSRVVKAIETYASPDAVIALDEGDSTLWFLRNFRARRQRIVLSDRWRTMGFGLPAAMAAKCCMPHKQVICVTGDGGLAMVLADLLTAARYRLAVAVIVLNNGALQMERNKMESKGLDPEGTELTNPDYVKLAEACGWEACRVQSEHELERDMQRIMMQMKHGPVLLDVPTARIRFPHYANS